MDWYLKVHKFTPWLICIIGVVLFFLSSCGAEVKLPQEILESQPTEVKLSPDAQQGYIGEPVSVSVSIPAVLSTSPSQDVIGSNIFIDEDDIECIVIADIVSPSSISTSVPFFKTATSRYTGSFISFEEGEHATYVSFLCTVVIDGETVVVAEGETETTFFIIDIPVIVGPPGTIGPPGIATSYCANYLGPPIPIVNISPDPRYPTIGFPEFLVITYGDLIPASATFTVLISLCDSILYGTCAGPGSSLPLAIANPGSTVTVAWDEVTINFATKTGIGVPGSGTPFVVLVIPTGTGFCNTTSTYPVISTPAGGGPPAAFIPRVYIL